MLKDDGQFGDGAMTEKELRNHLVSQRKIKEKKYQARQMIHEYDRELQSLIHKQIRYRTEYKRRLMIIKTEESDYRAVYHFNYEKHNKDPKMRKSVSRKKILLHDTLNTKFKNLFTPYDFRESEQYTVDLLKRAEQKDIEMQTKFLERIAEKAKKEVLY